MADHPDEETQGEETQGEETQGEDGRAEDRAGPADGGGKGGDGGKREGGNDRDPTGGDRDGKDKNAKGGGGDDGKDGDAKKGRTSPWPWIIAGAVLLVFVVIVLVIIFLPKRQVRTNDAYVAAHYAMVAARVSGQVSGVFVEDNQPVRAGQLLVTLDPRDYLSALHQAEAQLAADEAQVLQQHAQVRRQPAEISRAAAALLSANARLALSEADARRYANLAATGAGTVQQHQQADATLVQDEAQVRSAEADVSAQRRELEAIRANEMAALARVKEDEAAVERARLNLSYCQIRAPIDGTIDQRSTQVGDFTSPGAALMILVPLDALYITANYREEALRHMRPGQPVRIHVDAYDIWLRGVVDSVAPASGSALSPIPASNASGNFTKIVQRLPVKILISRRDPRTRLLRSGMSVETIVDTGLANVVGDQERAPGRVQARP